MLPGVQQALEDRDVKKLIDWYHSQFDSITADAKKALLTLDVEELVAAFLQLKHGGRRDAHLLAERDAPRAAELLTEAMRDGEAVAIRLLAGLVEADTRVSTASSARSVLQELVDSENRAGKITLAGALQPTSPAGRALLHALSIDPDAAVRIAVANRMSEALSQPGMEVLQSLLADIDADVRLAAVHAVRSPRVFPDNRVVPEEARASELVRALSDTDARVRAAAATLLGNIYGEFRGRDGAIRALSVSASDEDRPVRIASIIALARLGGSLAASTLVDLLVQDADVRGVTARAILNLPSGDGAPDLVLAALKHADADVRLVMTEAIANDAAVAKWAGSNRWLEDAGPLLRGATEIRPPINRPCASM